jgi:hypothetical protein
MSVLAHTFHFVVGTDAVEANADPETNRYRIIATAHAALRGDVIRFTSGAFSGREVRVHAVVDANNFDLAETLSAAPAAADTFEILRNKAPVINSDGTLFTASSGNISFLRDAVSTVVTEDTVTPANNRPLPVKLTDVTGDINITAGDIHVQLEHTGANFDSVRIGDGTDTLAVNADGSINVTTTESATAADGGALPAVVKVIGGFDGALVQAIATDASGNLQVDVLTLPAVTAVDLDIRDLSHTQDSVRIGDGVDLVSVTAANQMEVAVTASLPAGTNNIGDVDVLTQPARSHTTDSIRVGDGTDLLLISAAGEANVIVTSPLPAGTNNIGDVDVLTQPARSHTTDSIRIGDGVDLVNVTAANQLEVAVTAALPAGTNNIGDVDVLTQPARSHTTDSIRIGDGTDLLLVSAAGEANVIVTSPLPAGTNNIGDVDVLSLPYLSVVDLLDTPLLDASSTNIPGSAANSLSVVASLAANVKRIQVLDTTGFWIGVYSGAVATPTLLFVVGPGSDQTIEHSISSGTLISVRSMTAAAITTGEFSMNFMG